MTEPIQVKDREELLKIRHFLRIRGFQASVDEITAYLQEQEQATQPGLFDGPLFEKEA